MRWSAVRSFSSCMHDCVARCSPVPLTRLERKGKLITCRESNPRPTLFRGVSAIEPLIPAATIRPSSPYDWPRVGCHAAADLRPAPLRPRAKWSLLCVCVQCCCFDGTMSFRPTFHKKTWSISPLTAYLKEHEYCCHEPWHNSIHSCRFRVSHWSEVTWLGVKPD